MPFFQHFLGCVSAFNFVEHLKNMDNMKKIFDRWTGVNLGQVQFQKYCMMFLCNEHNRILL